MLKRFLGVFFVILLMTMTDGLQAQDVSFDKGKTYTLGGLEVTGLKSYNEQTVITFTGLRVGQEITVPGEQLSDVINKLWGLRLFSDINFYQTRIEGDTIYLELEIVELPTLTDAKINGVKDRKADAVLKEAEVKKGEKVTEGFLANTRNYLEKVLEHSELNAFYSPAYDIISEKELITARGEFLRPDRIMISEKEIIVVDYKTGERKSASNNKQVRRYSEVLKETTQKKVTGYLWYIKLNEIEKVCEI